MAIVKRWDGWFGKIRWHVNVKYSAKSEMFSIRLPEPAHEHFGEELIAKTQRAVIQDFHIKHEQFKDITCAKTQVILLQLDTENEDWARGIRLVLRCGVFEKRVWAAVKGLHINIAYDEIESSIPEEAQFVDEVYTSEANDYTELAWSPKTERQITNLVKGFISMRDKLQSICKTPTSLRKMLSGNKLLLRFLYEGN